MSLLRSVSSKSTLRPNSYKNSSTCYILKNPWSATTSRTFCTSSTQSLFPEGRWSERRWTSVFTPWYTNRTSSTARPSYLTSWRALSPVSQCPWGRNTSNSSTMWSSRSTRCKHAASSTSNCSDAPCSSSRRTVPWLFLSSKAYSSFGHLLTAWRRRYSSPSFRRLLRSAKLKTSSLWSNAFSSELLKVSAEITCKWLTEPCASLRMTTSSISWRRTRTRPSPSWYRSSWTSPRTTGTRSCKSLWLPWGPSWKRSTPSLSKKPRRWSPRHVSHSAFTNPRMSALP